MDYKRIETLLDKYWNCNTSVEEEEELRLFFILQQELPQHLVEIRDVFIFQYEEKQIRLDHEFDRKILANLQKDKPWRLNIRKYLIHIAALLILFIAVREAVVQQKEPEMVQTPEQALQEVKQALNFVSLKLNKSRQIIEKNMEEVETVTKYIKE